MEGIFHFFYFEGDQEDANFLREHCYQERLLNIFGIICKIVCFLSCRVKGVCLKCRNSVHGTRKNLVEEQWKVQDKLNQKLYQTS